MPPQRRAFVRPGQQGAESVATAAGGGAGTGLPSIPQVGRVPARPPMTGAQNPQGMPPPPVPLPADPSAGGATSPFRIGPMLQPNRTPAPPQPMPSPSLQPWGDMLGGGSGGQDPYGAGTGAGMDAMGLALPGDVAGAGAGGPVGSPSPVVILRLMKQMGLM